MQQSREAWEKETERLLADPADTTTPAQITFARLGELLNEWYRPAWEAEREKMMNSPFARIMQKRAQHIKDLYGNVDNYTSMKAALQDLNNEAAE